MKITIGVAAAVALLLPSMAASAVRRVVLGRSVDGRVIGALVVGDPHAKRRILVVGCIHGDESAGMAVTTRLAMLTPPRGTAIWIVDDLNPDGVVRGTRGNAHGVDLNRNFPWKWARTRGTFDSGAKPLSEPESRILRALVLHVRPQVTVWFHQHLGLVDESGGNLAVERRYARLVGLPLARLPREHGSAIGWENQVLPGSTAFDVELPTGSLAPADADRQARAVLALAH